jgi:hypothetical protein
MNNLVYVGIGILVILYMTYPRFLRRRLSSARFFTDLPLPKKRQQKLRFGRLQFNLPFFLQLFVLLFLLGAFLFSQKGINIDESKTMGIWIILDTSASMSTVQQGETRMVSAVKEIGQIINRVQETLKGKEICFRLSTVDMERIDIAAKVSASGIRQALKSIKPRPLGTDLEIIHRSLQSSSLQNPSQSQPACEIDYVLVVTDMPAPAWLGETNSKNNKIDTVWRDIGKPVDNLGFTGIRASRNPLTGSISEIKLEVTVFGTASAGTKLEITGPDGTQIKNETLNLQQDQLLEESFAPGLKGKYRMRLTPPDSYTYDDTAIINVDTGREIRVDWQLKDRSLLQQTGWIEDNVNPYLIVTDAQSKPGNIPTLIVGPGYSTGTGVPVEIRDFVETSPLLADVNLDAVESLGLQGCDLPGEAKFQPVLRGINGKVLLAQAENPLQAFVPGLPTGTNDITGRFSTTVFFNAVRWLLHAREFPPLYTLTSPLAPEPTDDRLTLHKDEGNTQRTPASYGNIEDMKPRTTKSTQQPLWPLLLTAAALFFLIERINNVFINAFGDLLS